MPTRPEAWSVSSWMNLEVSPPISKTVVTSGCSAPMARAMALNSFSKGVQAGAQQAAAGAGDPDAVDGVRRQQVQHLGQQLPGGVHRTALDAPVARDQQGRRSGRRRHPAGLRFQEGLPAGQLLEERCLIRAPHQGHLHAGAADVDPERRHTLCRPSCAPSPGIPCPRACTDGAEDEGSVHHGRPRGVPGPLPVLLLDARLPCRPGPPQPAPAGCGLFRAAFCPAHDGRRRID